MGAISAGRSAREADLFLRCLILGSFGKGPVIFLGSQMARGAIAQTRTYKIKIIRGGREANERSDCDHPIHLWVVRHRRLRANVG